MPVLPDADEARRWATEELARGIYAEQTGLVERLLRWLFERLDDLAAVGSTDVGWLLPVGAVLLTAAALVVTLVVGAPRRRLRARTPIEGVLDGEVRTALQLLADAEAASSRGDYAAAVLDRFRALVRSLGDRAILEERPGLTAHEAALEAGARLPDQTPDLDRAGRLFDRVRYGRASATSDEDAWLRDACARVAAARANQAARPSVRAPR